MPNKHPMAQVIFSILQMRKLQLREGEGLAQWDICFQNLCFLLQPMVSHLLRMIPDPDLCWRSFSEPAVTFGRW